MCIPRPARSLSGNSFDRRGRRRRVHFCIALVACVIQAELTPASAAQEFAYPGFLTMAEAPAGPAAPYPATINVFGLAATVQKVTVTIRAINHSWGDDLDVLLTGPGGQSVLLMSDVGGDNALTNVTLTFDSDAANSLPNLEQILSGTYRPTDFGGLIPDEFPSPAPPAPWGSSLAVFNGTNPNGAWSLCVVDDLTENGGMINQGWKLTIEPGVPIHDLRMAVLDAPDPVGLGAALTYTVTVSNAGPAGATEVVVTNQLPAGVTFVSAAASQGTCSQAAGVVTCGLGGLASGQAATVTVEVAAATPGTQPLTAGVSAAANLDPNPANNAATITSTVLVPPAIASQPASLTPVQGQTAMFAVEATGDQLAYQWRHDGAVLPGATVNSLTLPNVQPAHAGVYTVQVSNPVGEVTSSPATLTVLVPPAITAEPVSRTNLAGTTATFAVVASGTPPFTYRWYFGGSQLLPATTEAVLAIPNVQPVNAGSYHVVVENAAGTAASNPAILTVWQTDRGDAPAPYPTLAADVGAVHLLDPSGTGLRLGQLVDHEIDGAPNATATGDDITGQDDEDGVSFHNPWRVGEIGTITVAASGAGQLNAWADFNGNGTWLDPGEQIFSDQPLIAGPNGLSVSIPLEAVAGSCMTRFRFSTETSLGVTGLAVDGEVEDYAVPVSAIADLALGMAAQPDPVALGAAVTINLTVVNAGPSPATEVRVTNELPAGVTFVSATPSQGACMQETGQVRCALGTLAAGASAAIEIVANAASSGDWPLTANVRANESDPELTDNEASTSLTALAAPAITVQPQSQTVELGSIAALTVTATGDLLAYQWTRGGADLAGATGATLEFNPVGLADAGAYAVRISNPVGEALSDAATLTVVAPPQIVVQPACKSALAGTDHTFSVTATGEPAPGYQWYKDGAELTGQTGPTLALVNVQPADAGDYTVVVANTVASVTSAVARLAVRADDDPAYPDPLGGWAYVYSGDGVSALDNAALDGTWSHDNGSDSWSGDGRGAGVGLPGGVSSTGGVLTIEDAVTTITGNRRFYFMHDLAQDAAVANPNFILDAGVTLSFRARLTPPTDPLLELGTAPDGAVNHGDGRGMINIRQSGAAGGHIGFSLSRAVEDTAPSSTYSFAAAGLHLNNLFGEAPSGFVDPGELPTPTLLPLDSAVFHHFWITVQGNGADPGTHRVSIYLDGSLTPTVFNVTAGTAVDTVASMPVTNYLAIGLASASQVGTFDLDFIAYRSGAVSPTGFDDPVVLLTPPAGQLLVEGAVAQFAVDVGGSPPMNFQWYRDGAPIPGATDPAYETAPVTVADDGAAFTVVVENFCGSVTSAPAVLQLLLPPQIVSQPQSLVATNGDAVTLAVTATSPGPMTYQWRFNGAALAGATEAELTFPAVGPADAGDYDVVITNDAGTTLSAAATLTVRVLDFGDAPLPYPTLAIDDGARHVVVPGVHLGATVDYEISGQPTSAATGDDADGDDEDGVTFVTPLTVGEAATIEVVASVAGFLDAWIDFNGNGTWVDAGDQVFVTQALVPGLNVLQFTAPFTATVPETIARFRFSTAGGLSFDGPAADGEVEDYAVTIELIADLEVTMTAAPDPVAVGGDLTYTITVNNAGPSPAAAVILIDVLPANATFVSAAASAGGCAPDNGTVTCALGTLPSGSLATVQLVVRPEAEGGVENAASVATLATDPQPLNDATALAVSAQAPPVIGTGPVGQTVLEGETAVFSVAATGPSLSYQWRFAGADLAGETGATLTIADTDAADAGPYAVRVSNAVGAVESEPALLTVVTAPVIVTAPQTQTAYGGSDVTFTVAATGSEPLSYQWYFNTTNALAGAIGPVLVVTAVSTNDNGAYRVQVANSAGSVLSAAASLTVLQTDFGDAPAPYPTLLANNGARHLIAPGVFLGAAVDWEPDGQPDVTASGDDQAGADEDGVSFLDPLLLGQSAGLRVAASTNGFLDAWLDFNGNGSWADAGERIFAAKPLAAGVNTMRVDVPSAAATGLTYARFRFSTIGGLGPAGPALNGEVEDYAVTISPAMDLVLAQEATPAPVAVGTPLTYTVTVRNLGPTAASAVTLTDHLPAGVGLNSIVPSQGACEAAAGVITCDLGSLGPAGTAVVTISVLPTSASLLTNRASVTGSPLDVDAGNNSADTVVEAQVSPAITSHPENQSVTNGFSATFTVAATGTALQYQWHQNGTPLPGATNAALVLANVQLPQAGQYTVRVSNNVGSVLSAPAQLVVLAVPVILAQPQSAIVTEGATVTFSVSASGTEPLHYQWFFEGTEFVGAIQPSLTLVNVGTANAGAYRVRITNAVGAVLSAPATLTVMAAPQITGQPRSQTNFAGTTAQFTVAATGPGTLTYQWFLNGKPINGATLPVLEFPNVQTTNAGSYRVDVANEAGTTPSAVALLTVWAVDFGDAPDPTYPTLLAHNGAAHILQPGLYLGSGADFETDGQPAADATGDDAAGTDDEDGVEFAGVFRVGQSGAVRVLASAPGFLDAWMDFNHNGTWADFGEKILASQPLVAGTNHLSVAIPAGALTGNAVARFRFSTVGGLAFDGLAPDGEVEDYLVPIEPAIDLVLSGSGIPTAVYLGESLGYTLAVTNQGPSPAGGVVVSNVLPAAATFVSAASSQGTCTQAGGVVTCAIGNLPPGQGAVVNIFIQPTRAGSVLNQAQAWGNEFDVNPANNRFSSSTDVVLPAQVYHHPSPIDFADNGPALIYPSTLAVSGVTASVYKVTVTLSNLSHTFPDDMDILLIGPAGQGVVLMSDAGGGNALLNVTLTFDEDAPVTVADNSAMASGSYRPANHGTINDPYPPPAPTGPHTNRLSVFANTDPNGTWSLYVVDDAEEDFGNLANGWSLSFETLNPIADLRVAQAGSADPVALGSNLVYTVTVANAGPAAVPAVTFTDTLTGSFVLNAVTPSQGGCVVDGGLIACNLGPLAGGEQATVIIELTPTAGPQVGATATLTTPVLDPVPANNSAAVVTGVEVPTDIELIHPNLPPTADFGAQQVISLLVTNHGPDPVTELQLTDSLPAGFTFIAVTPSQGSCAQANGVVTCALGTLAAQATATVAITVQFDQLGWWTNVARIAAQELDSRPDNNIGRGFISVESAPVITAQPLSLTVTNGQPALLAVTAFGTTPLAYQWERNGSEVPGATSPELLIAGATAADAGSYRVRVSNRVGTTWSQSATLVVREPPVISAVPNQTVPEDTLVQVEFSVGDLETPPTDLAISAVSSNPALVPQASLLLAGAGNNRTLTFQPATNQFGTATLTLTVADTDGFQAVETFVLTVTPVNDLPLLTGLADTGVLEDTVALLAFTVADVETAANALAVSATSSDPALVPPAGLVLTASGSGTNRTLTVTPAADAFGTATLSVRVTDGDAGTVEQTLVLTVQAVNDPPTLAPLANRVIDENAPEQSVSLTGISFGPANEAQTLTVSARSSNPELIPDPVVVYASPDPAGTLRFTPLANQYGEALITVTVDDGGVSNHVATQSFTVTVNLVNDVPVITGLTDLTIIEDTATAALPFVVGDAESAAADLLLGGYASDTNKVASADLVFGGSGSNRTVTVTPRPDASGLITITLTATDPEGGVGEASFDLNITPVNDLPVLSPIPDQETDEDVTLAIPFHLYDPETPPESMVVLATPANQSLVPIGNIAFSANGSNWTVTVTPGANQHGFTRFTVSAVDSDGVVVRSTFNLTVRPVNDPPAFDPLPDLAIDEDAPEQILAITGVNAGPANEVETVTFSTDSDNPEIIPVPVVTYAPLAGAAELRFTPVPDTNGIVVITVTADDGQPENNRFSRTFRVIVGEVADPPAITPPEPQVMAEDTQRVVAFTLADFDTPLDDLVVSAESSNLGLISDASLVIGGSGANRTVRLQPSPNQFGVTTITLFASDGAVTSSVPFVVTVEPVNDAPTLDPLPSLVILEDAGPQVVPLTGITTGAANEDDPLAVTARSDNPALLPDPVVGYLSPEPAGGLVFATLPDAHGTARITVTVNDGQPAHATVSRTFTITVQPVNDPPAISPIAAQLIEENTATPALPFTVADPETPAGDLALAATSSHPDLVPPAGVVLGGSGANRTVTITPAAHRNGTTVITLTATDPENATTRISFPVTVAPVESLPTLAGAADQVTPEDTPVVLSFTVNDEDGPAEDLAVSGFAAHPALLPPDQMIFSGTGGTRTLALTPAANQFGQTTVTLVVTDPAGNVAVDTFALTVTPVNDPPTLNPPADLELAPGGEPHVVTLTGIGSGALNEIQALTVTALSGNPALLPHPAVAYTSPAGMAQLTLTPVAGLTGTATVSVTVNDEAGSGADSETTRTFVVTLRFPNEPPVIAPVPDQITPEATPVLLALLVGDGESPAADLLLSAESSDPSLLPPANLLFGGSASNRTLTLTPAPGQIGWTTVTLTVTDPNGGSTTTEFLLAVEAVNRAPTLEPIADQRTLPAIPVAVAVTVNDAETPADNLLLSATSSNPALVPAAHLVFTGTGTDRLLTLTPAPFNSGLAQIAITVQDERGSTTVREFLLTVDPTNLPPTISLTPDLSLPANSTLPVPLAVADPETPADDLTVTAAASNPTLLPNSSLVFNGAGAYRTLTVTPAPGLTGTATVTVTVTDGGGRSATDAFTVTVLDTGTPPQITIQPVSQSQPIGATVVFTVAASGTEPLAYQWRRNGLSLAGANAATLTLENVQAADAGEYRVQVASALGAAVSAPAILTVTGGAAGGAGPVISTVANRTTLEDTPLTVAITVSDPDTDPALLTLTGSSANPALINTASFRIEGTGANRTVTLIPVTNQFGTAQITLTVNDGLNSASTAFSLNVVPVNDFPTVDWIPDLAMESRASDYTINLTGISSGAANESQTLYLTATSTVPSLVKTEGFSYSSPSINGRFRVDPNDKAYGIYPITVMIREGSPTTNHLTFRTFNLYVHQRSTNNAPTITPLSDQTIAEDATTGPRPFTVGDAETPAGALTLVQRSSNPDLVPTNNIVFNGTGASRTVTVTPAPNRSGSAIISILVVDSGFGMALSQFTLTVTPQNDPPLLSNLPDRTVQESESTGLILFTVSDVETPAGSLSVTATSSNPTLVPAANLQLGGNGTNRVLQLQPAARQSGAATITVTASDGTTSISKAFVLTVTPVDDPPLISVIPNQTIPEDATTGPLPLFVSDTETAPANLVLRITSSNEALVPADRVTLGGASSNRTVTVTPLPDQHGTALITLTVTDEDAYSASSRFAVTVLAVNDPPTLDPLPDLALDVNAGPQHVEFSGITAGEPDQFAALSATSSNPTVIPHPTVAYLPGADSGTLTFTPLPEATGTVVISVTANDGQSAQATVTRTFQVAVSRSVSISAIPNQVMDEDTVLEVAFTVTDDLGNPADLVLTAAASNPLLLPPDGLNFSGTGTQRSLSLAPAAEQFGSASVTVTATSTNGFAATTTFLLIVNPLNDPPTIGAVANLLLPEDSGPQVLPLSAIGSGAPNEDQFLVVRARSSSPALVPDPVVTYTSPDTTGSLTLAPTPNAFGVAVITVTVNDLQSPDNLATTTFTVTVTAENDPPLISPIPGQTAPGDTTVMVSFTVQDEESAPAELLVSASAADPVLVPAAGLVLAGTGANRLLTITPAPGQTGATTITIAARDADNAVATQAFRLTVGSGNQPPVISPLPPTSVPEDTVAGPLPFAVSDAETAADALTLTATSSNPNLVPAAGLLLTGSGENRALTITPAPDASGTTLVTLAVTDAGGATAQTAFVLTISPENNPPMLQGPADQVMDEDTTRTVSFTVTDPDHEPENLLIRVTSSNPNLLAETGLTLGGTGTERTLELRPVIDQFGTALVTLTVRDAGGLMAQASFQVTVVDIADVPIIVSQPQDQTVTFGGTATFAVTATGAASLSYQWRRDGLPLDGETAPMLVIEDVQFADAGSYSVVVTSPEGSVTSTEARLELLLRSEIVLIHRTGTSVQLTFTTIAGLAYTVEYTTSLAQPVWLPIASLLANAATTSVIDPNATGTTRFYRVRLE